MKLVPLLISRGLLGIAPILSLTTSKVLAQVPVQNPAPAPQPGAAAPPPGQAPLNPSAPPATPPGAAPAAPSPLGTPTAPATASAAAPTSGAEVQAENPAAGYQSATATVLPDPRLASEEKAEAPPPDKLTVANEGFFQPGALFQIWVVGSHQDKTLTQLRLRRAEVKASGVIVPDLLKYKVMFDLAKVLEFNDTTLAVSGEDENGEPITGEVNALQPASNVSVLQDVSITWVSEYADVSLGQFKTPLSWEGKESASKVLFPERAAISRYYGDRRDLGIQAEKKFEYVNYQVGVYNGPGQNRADNNNQKDAALRLELLPVKGLMLGGVGYMSIGERTEPTTKDRAEGDLRLDMANVLIQAEYLHGWDGASDSTRTEGHGFYAAAAYTFMDKLQPMVRFGYIDPNLDSNGTKANKQDEGMIYELGLNYYVAKDFAKLQLSGTVTDYDDDATKTDVIFSTQISY